MADNKESGIIKDDDLELFGPKVQKVYRGAYKYLKGNTTYSEENFEVFRDKKELTFTFVSESITRVSTGELLKINVIYVAGKDFVPLNVTIKKDLGRETSEETFKLDDKKNLLKYTFKNKRSKETIEMNVPPRFHICTPTAVTSMLFFLTKKFDSTSKNFYTMIQSFNEWEYKLPVVTKSLVLERISLTSETIYIDGNELQAVQYKMYEDPKTVDPNNPKPPDKIAFVYLSRYHAIPYSLKSDDGTTVQIKFFNNLAEDD